ncbi:MAG: DUF1573 domain-containing protein [Planctomycetes bacterium]|nr:DUF1573 domain-containing protein [Planctomycetota bacterium]
MVNDTSDLVRFKPVRASCGCMTASLDKLDLSPGDEAVLRVRVDNRRVEGQRELMVRLPRFEDTPWFYGLSMTIYRRAKFSQTGCMLGDVFVGRSAEHAVELTTAGRGVADLALLDQLTSSRDELEVSVVGHRDVKDAEGVVTRTYDVRLALAPQPSADDCSARVRAVLSLGSERYEESMDVEWRVQAYYGASPERIFFGDLRSPDGEDRLPDELERRVVLRALGSRPLFALKSIESTHPAVSWAAETNADEGLHVLTVKLDPTRVDDNLWGRIVVETGDPDQPNVAVPFAAIAHKDVGLQSGFESLSN